MATSAIGVHGRRLTIDGNNPNQPGSVFIAGGRAFVLEMTRESFLTMVCKEFDLVPRAELSILRAA